MDDLVQKMTQHKVESYIYCVNQFLRKKRHKILKKNIRSKNIFDLLTSRTEKTAW